MPGSAVSAFRIVENKNKETVCYCRGDRNPELLSCWHSDSHMLGSDICVEICGGWMNPEPSEPPKWCSASVQRMDSRAHLHSNETCVEAFQSSKISEEFTWSLQSALSSEQSLLIMLNPKFNIQHCEGFLQTSRCHCWPAPIHFPVTSKSRPMAASLIEWWRSPTAHCKVKCCCSLVQNMAPYNQ